MLDKIRDFMATIAFGEGLAAAREEYILLTIKGQEPDPSFWEHYDALLRGRLRQTFFSQQARAFFAPKSDPNVTNEKDYADRDIMGEVALLLTHERLRSIPFVGHPAYGDD
jgi:hypothetical protein